MGVYKHRFSVVINKPKPIGVWEQRRLRGAHTGPPLPTPGAEGEVCVYTGFEWPWPKERARTFTRGCGRGRLSSMLVRKWM